jgi:hypothetical protein
MNISTSQLECFVDEKMMEFNRDRATMLREISADKLLPFHPLVYAFRSNSAVHEIIRAAIDYKLILMEQTFISRLSSNLKSMFGATTLFDSDLSKLIHRIIKQAVLSEEVFTEYASAQNRCFPQFLERFCDKAGCIDWVKITKTYELETSSS